MKFAPIVPTGILPHVKNVFGYQMALAQYILRDEPYSIYMQASSGIGAHVILDNGAAEHEPLSITDLLKAANIVQADEVVLPDKLKEADATLELHTHTKVMTGIPPTRRMIVVQGSTWAEIKHFLHQVRSMHTWFKYNSIGVPKHLESLPGGRARAIKLIVEYGMALDHHIHLLGVYAKPFEEVIRAYEAYHLIRGIDTGAPVAYAQNRAVLNDRTHYSLNWTRSADPARVETNIIFYTIFCGKGLEDELQSFRSKVSRMSPGQRTFRDIQNSRAL